MSDKSLSAWATQLAQIVFLGLFMGLTLVLSEGCAKESQTPDVSEPKTDPIKVQEVDEGQDEVAEQRRPKIEFESVEYDFGEVVPKAKAVGHFRVTNAGSASLEISEVKKCCGAALSWSKKTLKPGESSELQVTYSFLNVGAMKKNLYVSSNDPDAPRITLTIKGRVARKVSWTPTKIKLFLNQENAGAKPIHIKSLDGKPFAIKQFKATGDIMSADVDPNAQAAEFTLVPEVDVDKLSQMEVPQGRVQIFHTHPGAQTIGLNYDLLARFSFTPPRIIIFSATPERKEQRKLWLLDNYSDDESDTRPGQANQGVLLAPGAQGAQVEFEIDSVRSEKGSVTVSRTDPMKNGYQLLLDIAPPEPEPGSRKFTDMLQIKIKDGKELSIAVNGYYSNKARSKPK